MYFIDRIRSIIGPYTGIYVHSSLVIFTFANEMFIEAKKGKLQFVRGNYLYILHIRVCIKNYMGFESILAQLLRIFRIYVMFIYYA